MISIGVGSSVLVLLVMSLMIALKCRRKRYNDKQQPDITLIPDVAGNIEPTEGQYEQLQNNMALQYDALDFTNLQSQWFCHSSLRTHDPTRKLYHNNSRFASTTLYEHGHARRA